MVRLFLLQCLVLSAAFAQIQTFPLGGSLVDRPVGVRIDSLGNTYIAGTTNSPDFPTTQSIASTPAQLPRANSSKVFVTKLNPSGAVEFSLVIGGSLSDTANAMTMDASGAVYITGSTQSNDFPVTPGAFQTRLKGAQDSFITKISTEGKLLYSTYLGGTGPDFVRVIAVDGDGNAYVAGITESLNFPVTPGAFQKSRSPDGRDVFVAKLDPAGAKLVWATYLSAGSSDPAAIAVGPDLRPVITGATFAASFPVRNALQPLAGGLRDGFITKLTADGSDLVFSTFMGGVWDDAINAVSVDADNSIYVAGTTGSSRFPAAGGQHPAGNVLVRISPSGEAMASQAGLTASDVIAIASAPSDPRVMYAGSSEGLFKSTDAGASWIATALDQISVGVIVVDARNPDVIYAGSRSTGGNGIARSAGKHGGLWKSTDGGLSFRRLQIGPPVSLPFDTDFLLPDPRDPDTLYVSFGGAYKTKDGGASWSPVALDLGWTGLALDPQDPSILYAAMPGRAATFCLFCPSFSRPSSFWKSVDGGTTFTYVTELGGFPNLTAINGLLYSGSRVSADRGVSWTEIPIPGGRVLTSKANRLYAIEAGRLFESADQGFDWNPVAAAFYIISQTVAVSPNGLYLGNYVWSDAFLTRLDSSGGLIYTKLFGGTGYDAATSVVTETDGRVIVSGFTTSADFPLAGSPTSPATGFDPLNASDYYRPVNAFVTEFDDSGNIAFSTTAGLSLASPAVTVDVNSAGKIAVAATSLDSHVSIMRIDR